MRSRPERGFDSFDGMFSAIDVGVVELEEEVEDEIPLSWLATSTLFSIDGLFERTSPRRPLGLVMGSMVF